ncbi:RuBisCO large subunit C-terminal-like domain-containing protein [Candidatus Methylacidithermus pantelleriae]|uniref:Ribulose bisphosphate carboxylase-like protein n=1 Tax=Candidatus Methylacidithermus pantelleriae TaxID=2744239 RepID=A0A8J2BS84_9BACT|nr:RuBisCO large subunit C-terminal-like domain-containing protein [Candidatus Methylacidithermus pantelleriae]CAF0696023.1 Ribulose bisphosphate carboxylase-like protein [Candidatus Methylacidithermus pantelleriae]
MRSPLEQDKNSNLCSNRDPVPEGALRVTYRLACSPAEAQSLAQALLLEQTVELPSHAVGREALEKLGTIESIHQKGKRSFEVHITYRWETLGGELPQALNVIFGNVSLWKNVRLVKLEPSPCLQGIFPGARLGQAGLRETLGVEGRPLLCSALKPMGLDVSQLALLAAELAAGGVDIVKEDHGLGNQPFAPFGERVYRCSASIQDAASRTGKRTLYVPNVTAPMEEISSRARLAKKAGAGGLLLCPGISGWDSVRMLATDPELGLPLFVHPALLGSFIAKPQSGFSPEVLFGTLPRLVGADATIFPHWRSRFPFSRASCARITNATREHLYIWKAIFPVPAGGIKLEELPTVLDFYGKDAILLIGGSLLSHPEGLQRACSEIFSTIQKKFPS